MSDSGGGLSLGAWFSAITFAFFSRSIIVKSSSHAFLSSFAFMPSPSRAPEGTWWIMDLDYDPNLLLNDLEFDGLNWNRILYENYLSVVVPVIAAKGHDKQHGCTILADIAVLQALSKRVAKSKYWSNPGGFQRLVDTG
ncbi:hypothetical protein ACHAWF_010834 [Thalassiosira exigua]